MYQKWIINNGHLLLGHVDFHRDFLKDNTLTIGGGWWHLDKKRNILFLYNTSSDFGQIKKEDFNKAIKSMYEKHTIYFSLKHDLQEVIKDYKNETSK